MTWRACGIRSCAAGFCTTGASTNPSCTQSSVISTTFWLVGPCGNTSGSAGTLDAPHIGLLRWRVGSRGCLPTGISWANDRAAGCWEPYERRRSRTVLRAPGGDTPPGDSPGDHLQVRGGGASGGGGCPSNPETTGGGVASAEDADCPCPAWLRVPGLQDQRREGASPSGE